MDTTRLTIDINRRAREIAKGDASEITPKTGTSARFLQYYVIGAGEMIAGYRATKEPEIKSNSERLAKKYADEANAPIYAELKEYSDAVKKSVHDVVNRAIDNRIKQINYSRNMPIRDSRMQLLQTIRVLCELNEDIPESDWKLWGEQFAGHYLEEKVFSALAKTKGITIIPTVNPERSAEHLEAFRQMANIAIKHLDNPGENLTALSFLKVDANNPLGQLMHEIDLDMASIIPAEKLTVVQRLKDAKENAYNKDNVMLSVKIGSFIDRNIDKLATPEEINESLYAEAEELIQRGMTAKKGDE